MSRSAGGTCGRARSRADSQGVSQIDPFRSFAEIDDSGKSCPEADDIAGVTVAPGESGIWRVHSFIVALRPKCPP
jgi:hypothetical protein